MKIVKKAQKGMAVKKAVPGPYSDKRTKALDKASMFGKGKMVPMKPKANGGGNFGMLSVKAGIDKNPNPTQADRIAGAKGMAKHGKSMKKAQLGVGLLGGLGSGLLTRGNKGGMKKNAGSMIGSLLGGLGGGFLGRKIDQRNQLKKASAASTAAPAAPMAKKGKKVPKAMSGYGVDMTPGAKMKMGGKSKKMKMGGKCKYGC